MFPQRQPVPQVPQQAYAGQPTAGSNESIWPGQPISATAASAGQTGGVFSLSGQIYGGPSMMPAAAQMYNQLQALPPNMSLRQFHGAQFMPGYQQMPYQGTIASGVNQQRPVTEDSNRKEFQKAREIELQRQRLHQLSTQKGTNPTPLSAELMISHILGETSPAVKMPVSSQLNNPNVFPSIASTSSGPDLRAFQSNSPASDAKLNEQNLVSTTTSITSATIAKPVAIENIMQECANLATSNTKAKGFRKPQLNEIQSSGQRPTNVSHAEGTKAVHWDHGKAASLEGIFTLPTESQKFPNATAGMNFVPKPVAVPSPMIALFPFPAWLKDEANLPESYKKLAQFCDPNSSGFPDTGLVYQTLMHSGLSREILGQIWALVNRTMPGQLTRNEFFAAVALAALSKETNQNPSLEALNKRSVPPEIQIQSIGNEISANLSQGPATAIDPNSGSNLKPAMPIDPNAGSNFKPSTPIDPNSGPNLKPATPIDSNSGPNLKPVGIGAAGQTLINNSGGGDDFGDFTDFRSASKPNNFGDPKLDQEKIEKTKWNEIGNWAFLPPQTNSSPNSNPKISHGSEFAAESKSNSIESKFQSNSIELNKLPQSLDFFASTSSPKDSQSPDNLSVRSGSHEPSIHSLDLKQNVVGIDDETSNSATKHQISIQSNYDETFSGVDGGSILQPQNFNSPANSQILQPQNFNTPANSQNFNSPANSQILQPQNFNTPANSQILQPQNFSSPANFGKNSATKSEGKKNAEDSVDRHLKIWLQCLAASLEILNQAVNVFSQASSSNVCKEVFSTNQGATFLKSIVEIYRVVCRIRLSLKTTAYQTDQVVQLLSDIEAQWDNLSAFAVGTNQLLPSKAAMDYSQAVMLRNSDRACGLCLLNVECPSKAPEFDYNNHKLQYGGKWYHSQCANLWVNCVDSVLPALNPPHLI